MGGNGKEREKEPSFLGPSAQYPASQKTHIRIFLIELNPVLWYTLSS